MKIVVALAAVTLALAGCSNAPARAGSTATTTASVYGPTVEDPQPLTPRERFILDYRSMKPGDTRTDTEVFELAVFVCDALVNRAVPLDVVLQGFADQGFTPEQSGWIVARAECY